MPEVALPQLHRRFHGPETYRPTGAHRLLPFRFTRLDTKRYVITSLAGEHLVVERRDVQRIIDGDLRAEEPLYEELLSRHLIMDSTSDVALDLLATKYRTKLAHLADFTGLHIFVVTLRCDHSCPYCQVSRVSEDAARYDMSMETAERAVALVFRSPNRHLKVEFQGGESLLNFDLIRFIVQEVESRNVDEQRTIEFVIATNLAPLTDSMLEYCRDHRIYISTSLDGPEALHNANRPRPGNDSHQRAVEGIARCREVLGHDAVSALMTTTSRSLDQPEAIIDEYRRLEFDSVFLRWMSPYGFASKTASVLGYPANAWNRFYERGLRYILSINTSGERFQEDYASIILRKMLTPFATGYVDLQSPSGLGCSVAVYNYDGGVYASDEARMLAESGDQAFRLGNVEDSYEELFGSARLLELLMNTMTEGTPMCHDCAFEPFCGTDPILHHATQGDPVGHRPTSLFCQRNMSTFRLLITLLEDDPLARNVLESWAAP